MGTLMDGEIRAIEEYIDSGDVVFDVGANVGEWSRAVKDRFPDVILHQFEPAGITFGQLVNQFVGEGVRQNNLVVSDFEGPVDFYYYGSQPTLSTVDRRAEWVEKQYGLHGLAIEKSRATQLDQYCGMADVNKIGFLKVDVEGGEFRVLRGAKSLLGRKAIRVIQFEYGMCYKDSGFTLMEVVDFLEGYGYDVFKLTGQGLVKVLIEDFVLNNYIALMRS